MRAGGKGVVRRKLLRWHRGSIARGFVDELAGEEPLEIRVNGRPVSVTMRTPGNDLELAAGFLLSEGMVRCAQDLRDIQPAAGGAEDCNIVDALLSPAVRVDFQQLTRHVFASSSCGLCGKASIAAVHRHFPPVSPGGCISASTVLALPERLKATQPAFARTGGLHAAAVFDAEGDLLVAREDVGRHNAVDKVLGFALVNGLMPLDGHVLVVSGRSSFEIMQKALAGRIPIVAAVSAASSLAVQFAEESGQTLVGFLRGQQMNVYSGSERIRFEEPRPAGDKPGARPVKA